MIYVGAYLLIGFIVGLFMYVDKHGDQSEGDSISVLLFWPVAVIFVLIELIQYCYSLIYKHIFYGYNPKKRRWWR